MNENIILSAIRLSGPYEKLEGKEAIEAAEKMGLKFIHVDDEGRLYSLNAANTTVNGMFVYKTKYSRFRGSAVM